MRIVVWDLPTRLFHWALTVLVVGLFVTGKAGGEAMYWHARFGYAVGALLLFRIVWGFIGGRWSRFSTFIPSLPSVRAYVRGARPAAPGHNPLGALSVYAMLLCLALQVASGLFSETKDDFAGPLSLLVSNDTARLFTRYHKIYGEPILLALVVMHLVAVAWYASRGANLLAPMVTGFREVTEPAPGSRDDALTRIRAAVVLSLCSLAVWWIVKLGG